MLMIKGGNIFTMAGDIIHEGYILIESSKIVEVGKFCDVCDDIRMKDVTKIIDASDKFVLPGLIDAHCHLGLWEDSVGFEGEDGNEMTEPVTPHLRAIDGIYHLDKAFTEGRESGITTVVVGPGSANVIGGQFAALKTYGNSIEEMLIKEPVALKIAFGENPKTVYNDKRQTPMTRMAIAGLLRESLFEALDYKNKWEKYNEDEEDCDRPDYNLKMEILVKVINKEIPLKAHAHRADDILTAIRIAKEFNINISIEHCTDGYLIADILAKEGIPAVVGPSMTDRSKIELKNQNLKTPSILANAGVKIAIMTDHPCTPVQYLTLCAALAVREGLDENEALKAITINAATISGIDDRVGSLEVSKDADVVIFNKHPLDIMAKVDVTIINGQVIYERK